MKLHIVINIFLFFLQRISKYATPGSYLQGTLTFSKDEIGKKVDSHIFKYIISEPAKKNSSPATKTEKEKTTKWDEYQEAIRDLKCNYLAKFGNLIFIHIYVIYTYVT